MNHLSIITILAALLTLWYETDFILKLGGRIKFLRRILELEQYGKYDTSYADFLLIEYHDRFWAQLLGCYKCLGFWGSVIGALLCGSIKMIGAYWIGALILYLILKKLSDDL